MISLIICSRTRDISDSIKANIASTIGVDYEIVVIDNSGNEHSIFEAYNIGAKRSKYGCLCFMHDDIVYHTDNWGLKVLNHFKDEQIGAIGIAGSPYVTQMTGSWWAGAIGNQYILPVGKPLDEPLRIATTQTFIKNEVIVLDGVWMCIKRSIFDKIQFDEHTYRGYHFYDIDICMQIYQCGFKLFTIFNVLISHHSVGNMDATWCRNAIAFNKKWNQVLPLSCIPLSHNQRYQAELKTLREFVNIMLANNLPRISIYKLVLTQFAAFKIGYLNYKTPIYLFRYLNLISSYENHPSH